MSTSNKMILRDAEEKDMEAILGIYNEAILNTTAVYSEEPHTLEMRRTWFRDRKSQGFPVFVALVDNEVAGFSTYGPFRAWPCYGFTVEHSVYVDTRFRGMGVGKVLLQQVIDHARQANKHAMIAGIDADNTISYALHQSFGFSDVALLKEVGFKFGRWLDLRFMELIL